MGATQKRHGLKLPLLVVFWVIAYVLACVRSGLPCATSFDKAILAKHISTRIRAFRALRW
jgi:hypothetical protein